MLEHLGAYGIDADALTHRAMARERWIPASGGRIWPVDPRLRGTDRSLPTGRVVFSDAAALAQLEAILHPLVRQAIDVLVRALLRK